MTPLIAVPAILDQSPGNLDEVRDQASELVELISVGDVVWSIIVLAGTYALFRVIKFILEALAQRLVRQRPYLLQSVALVRVSLWAAAAYMIVFGILEPSRESLVAVWAAGRGRRGPRRPGRAEEHHRGVGGPAGPTVPGG